jgi:hypothetical protein
MNPAAATFGSDAAQGAGAAATAAADTDWAQLREELLAVDAKWAANKAGNAREWCLPASVTPQVVSDQWRLYK